MISRLLPCVWAGLTLAALSQPAPAELVIQKVWPDKIYYHPGETAALDVQVANPDAAPATAQLVVEVRHDLDTSIALSRQTIMVPPGQPFAWHGTWQAQPVLGAELCATLTRNGQVLAQGREFFTCARSVHQVLMPGRGNHGGWQFSGTSDPVAYPTAFAREWRAQYGNVLEKFAWAPSDFDAMTPTAERWWSGQTAYNESKPNMIAVINAMHREGVQVFTYGKAAGGGTVGYELLRRHPQLLGYTDGRPWLEGYDAAYLDFMDALGPPHAGEKRAIPGTPADMEKSGYTGAGWFAPFTSGGQKWCSVWYGGGLEPVVDTYIRELAGSARMFGFDGVRFDGELVAMRNQTLDGSFTAPANFDAVAADTALVRRLKAACQQAKPGYQFGYNPQSAVDVQWSVPADNTPLDFREKSAGDGLIANEMLAFPGDIPWLEYAERVRREANLVRHYGGHYATYAFNRNGDRLYNFIVNYASRGHLMNPYTADTPRLNAFATRFARLLWDDGLCDWKGAAQAVSVEADHELWWQPFAAARPLPGGGTQFILHLINPPDGPTTLSPQKLPTAPARDVHVVWKSTTGFRRAMLVDLTTNDAVALTPQRGTAGLTFTVPEIQNWAMLVVEADAPIPPVTWDAPSAKSTIKTPSAADLQLAPNADTPVRWRSVIEPEQWGGGEATAARVPDSDALNGSAVHGEPGRPPGSMAYTYGYPRIPGRYTATFRLKVADKTVARPVFFLQIDDTVSHRLPGVPKLPNPGLKVMATDFKQSNVYQDFTIPFEHSDVGFLGVGCTYLGGVAGSWDRVTLQLVEPWTTERLLQHYAAFAPPAGLALRHHDGFNVLLVRGLWNRLYHLDEAVAQCAPRATSTSAYTTYSQQQDTQLKGFNLDWQPLFDQDVVVLANVEARGLGVGQVRMLAEFVKQGGGLVILGGLVTLGQNRNMERYWPEFLPVEMNAPWEIRECAPPVRVGPPPAASPLAGVNWDQPAVVLFRHMIQPKPNTTLLLAGAHGEPLFVGGRHGQGRVAVFTGTVLGEAPAGAVEFWNTPAWTQTLAKAIRWTRNMPGG